MTWSELKSMVDKVLAEEGLDDVDIWYIDISHPTPEDVSVKVDRTETVNGSKLVELVIR